MLLKGSSKQIVKTDESWSLVKNTGERVFRHNLFGFEVPLLLPGDIIFCESGEPGIMSKLILWGTQTWNESKSLYSHVCLHHRIISQLNRPIEKIGDQCKIIGIEQTAPEQTLFILEDKMATQSIAVYRLSDIKFWQQYMIDKLAQAELGKRYGFLKIALMAGDIAFEKLISSPVLFGNLFGKKWKGLEFPILSRIDATYVRVCSQTVAHYYNKVVPGRFKHRDAVYSPDTMHDEIIHADSPFECVIDYERKVA